VGKVVTGAVKSKDST
jgi:hypothetical protein